MLAPLNPRETPTATPLRQGSFSFDQPFGALPLPVALTTRLRLSLEPFEPLGQANPEVVLRGGAAAVAAVRIMIRPSR